MSLPVPKLDDRAFDDLVKEATRRIREQCPQWTDFNASDPGMTLVDVMAWMTEIILYRLNRVPDRNYIKLLELMGVHLRPAQPAHSWVKFEVGNLEVDPERPVPAGTKVSTPRRGSDEPVNFETVHPLYLTTAKLIQVRSQTTENETDHTPHLDGFRPSAFLSPRDSAVDESGELLVDEPIFCGANAMPHVLYLIDKRLDFGDRAVTSVLQLRLIVDLAAPLSGPVDIEWERWDGAAWVPSPPTKDETGGLRQSGSIVFEDLPVDDATEALRQACVGPGNESTWALLKGKHYTLRGRLLGGAMDTLPVLTSLQRNLEVNPQRALVPEKVMLEVVDREDPSKKLPPREIDTTREFYPFGQDLRPRDTLYVRSSAFGRKNATVTLTVKRAAHPVGATDSVSDFKWEYHAADGWKPLILRAPGATASPTEVAKVLVRGGQATFDIPADVAPVANNGDVGSYIRVQVDEGSVVSGASAPMLSALSIHFVDRPENWDQYWSVNYQHWVDCTSAITVQHKLPPFTSTPDKEPTLYFVFTKELPNQPQRLYVTLAKPSDVPKAQLAWEYGKGAGWEPLQVIDDTHEFSRNGQIEFVASKDWKRTTQFDRSAAWLRCRFQLGDRAPNAVLDGVYLNAAEVVQARSFRDEILGSSTGKPLQTFRVIWTPVLPGSEVLVRERDAHDALEVERLNRELGPDATIQDPNGALWVRWQQVESFYESKQKSRHYTLDPIDGVVSFGDGKHGMCPPAGRDNIKVNVYQQTAGAHGNVRVNTITNLEDSIPGVDKVRNVEVARGGADPETIEEAKLRGPYELKARHRAVTKEDFEYLAGAASGQVAKARCVSEWDAAGRAHLTVVILPKTNSATPRPRGRLINQVEDYLDEHRLLTTRVRVIGPQYEGVRIHVTVKPTPQYRGRFPDLKAAIEQRLRSFIHPLPGPGRGPEDDGWVMGRTLHKSELYYLVEQVPGVDYVDRLCIWKWLDRHELKTVPDSGEGSPTFPEEERRRLEWRAGEAQDNIYIGTHAYHYFREIDIEQV